LQVERRQSLVGRLAARALLGQRSPRFSGFRLWRLALGEPKRNVRFFLGTIKRHLRNVGGQRS
jgi:hypothetical protein